MTATCQSDCRMLWPLWLLLCIEEPANCCEILVRRAARRERLHHQARGGTAERPIEQITHEEPLRIVLAEPRLVHVRAVVAAAKAAVDKALLGHDLQQF